jgi:hypothetical protein
MTSDDSFISAGKGGTLFAGPDAVALYRAIALRSALRLYVETGLRANRAYTPTAMRAAASRITRKPYKRTELARAMADLTLWIDAMKAALPVIAEGGR